MSITYRLEKFVYDQVVVDLNYYSVAFKNDLLQGSPESKVGYWAPGELSTSQMIAVGSQSQEGRLTWHEAGGW